MSIPVLVLGAGGHAKVLVEALLQGGALIAGIVDAAPATHGTSVLGVPVLGGDEVVAQFPPEQIELVNGIGSVGVPQRRSAIFRRFRQEGYRFATVVHPGAIVASDALLGEGAQVMAGAVIQPGCRIGDNAIVNTRACVDHDCSIGDHTHIAPGVTLSGGVRVGEGAHLGTGATVIQGIAIGEGALVAAGAVVVSGVAAGSKVRGVPARGFA